MKLAVVLLLAACEQPRTELVVGVVTDIHAPDLLDGAQLIITRANDGFVEQDVSWQLSGLPDQPFNLPGSYGVYSDGDEVKLDVTLRGLKGDNLVVTRRSVLNLVEGKTLFFRMSLVAGCADRTDCLETQNCVEGVCRDVYVDSRQLPEFQPELVDHLTCSNGTAFINTATGAELPLTEGAENCPASLCLEGVCLNPPPEPESGTRTVTGYQFTTFVEATKSTNVPTSTAAPIAALVPQSDGTYTTIPGRSNPDGSFVIDQVPNGTYYLQSGNNYFVTDADVFDLTEAVAGRPDVKAASANTGVNLQSLTNLGPWVDTDAFEIVAPGADLWWFYLNTINPIPLSATSLTNYSFANSDASSSTTQKNLIVGDAITAIQLQTKTSPTTGIVYQAATKYWQSPPFTQTDGTVTNVAGGALIDLPQTSMAQASFPAAKWDAMAGWDGTALTAFNPQAAHFAGSEYYGFYVHSQVGGAIYGQFSATADFMFAGIPHGQDVPVSDFTFGAVPLQGQWATIASADLYGYVPYTVPGTNMPATMTIGTRQTTLLSTLTQSFMDPKLGPVGNPTIDGLDMFQSQMAQVSTTPTLTWQQPTIGNPSLYTVRIFELTVNGSATKISKPAIATLTTSQTSLAVPPGILMLGHYYALTIQATNAPNIDAPYRLRLPEYSSITASAMFVPTVEGGTVRPPGADGGMGSGSGTTGVDAGIFIDAFP